MTEAVRVVDHWKFKEKYAKVHRQSLNKSMTLQSEVEENHLMPNDLALHKAASAGDDKKVQSLLDEGANPLSANKGGETPLHLACQQEEVRLLLKVPDHDVALTHETYCRAHLPQHYQDLQHEKARYEAEEEAARETAQKEGRWYDPKPPPPGSDTIDRVRERYALVVDLLIQSDLGDCNIRNKNGIQGVHLAARMGCLKTLDTLRGAGADFNSSEGCGDGQTPLIIAILHRHPEAARFIAEEISEDVNKTDRREMSALHHAVAIGNEEMVEILLDHINFVDIIGPSYRTPLMWAIDTAKSPTIVNMLLAQQANPNHRDANNNTPLYLAAVNASEDIVELLMMFGADPDLPAGPEDESGMGRTPIYWSAKAKHKAVTEILLDHGATAVYHRHGAWDLLDDLSVIPTHATRGHGPPVDKEAFREEMYWKKKKQEEDEKFQRRRRQDVEQQERRRKEEAERDRMRMLEEKARKWRSRG